MLSDTELHNGRNAPAQKNRKKLAKVHLTERDEPLLSNLSLEHRAILLAEGTYKELAEQFGIPVGTVRSRLHRARASLLLLQTTLDEVAEKQTPVS